MAEGSSGENIYAGNTTIKPLQGTHWYGLHVNDNAGAWSTEREGGCTPRKISVSGNAPKKATEGDLISDESEIAKDATAIEPDTSNKRDTGRREIKVKWSHYEFDPESGEWVSRTTAVDTMDRKIGEWKREVFDDNQVDVRKQK